MRNNLVGLVLEFAASNRIERLSHVGDGLFSLLHDT